MAGITQKVNNKLIYIKVPCRNGYKEKESINKIKLRVNFEESSVKIDCRREKKKY